jgi:hypothetical protein
MNTFDSFVLLTYDLSLRVSNIGGWVGEIVTALNKGK